GGRREFRCMAWAGRNVEDVLHSRGTEQAHDLVQGGACPATPRHGVEDHVVHGRFYRPSQAREGVSKRRAGRGRSSRRGLLHSGDSVPGGYTGAMLTTAELFDLGRVPPELRRLLDVDLPWDVLARLDEFGASLVTNDGDVHPTAVVEGPLFMAPGAKVGPHAFLTGPVYLAAGADVGHAARIRGPVVLGPEAHVGHASEVKRSLLLGGA